MQDFDQQLQLAQQRRQQFAGQRDFQAPQGKMVGRHFVAPNALEHLAAGLRSFNGIRGQDMAEQEMRDVQSARTGANQSAMANALRMMGGAEADAPLPEGQHGPVRPAQAPDMRGAYAELMKSPDYAQMGQQGMIGMAQDQAKRTQAQAEQQRLMAILQNSTPQQAMAAGVPPELVKSYFESPNIGRSKVSFKDVGGQLVPVDEYGATPQGVKPLDKTGNPFSDLLVRGPDGGMTPNAPLVGVKTGIARAGKPVVNVDARNYNTQESEQSKVYGKTLGEMRGTITQAGFDAPKKIAQLDRMEQLIGGLDAGGKAAPLAADIASYAQSMGIKLDPKLGAKEAAQALAIEMASNMRQPGTGPMTDKDFDNFLRRVPDLSKTPEGRKQITTTMRSALQRDLEASKFARDYAKANGGVIDDNFHDSMADFYAKNPVITPELPKTNARGQTLPKFDSDKEARFQAWKKAQGLQ